MLLAVALSRQAGAAVGRTGRERRKRPGFRQVDDVFAARHPAPVGGIGEQRAQQAVVERVAAAMRHEPAAQGGAGQGEVADRVQQLVAHELVRHAQAAGVQHAGLVHHHRIVEAAAEGEAGCLQLRDFAGQREGAGARQFGAEHGRGEPQGQAPAGRSPQPRTRSTSPCRGRSGDGRSSANPSPSLTRTVRRISISGGGGVLRHDAGAVDQEHQAGRGAVQDRGFRAVDRDDRVGDAAAGERRHHMLDGADAHLRLLRQAQHGAKAGVDHVVEAGGDVGAEVAAAEHDAGADRRGMQGHLHAAAGMHADADAADRGFQRTLGIPPGERGILQRAVVGEAIHRIVFPCSAGDVPKPGTAWARRGERTATEWKLRRPHSVRQSIIISECFDTTR